MVNEAFTLGNRDFRLPGLGSYMNEAVQQGDGAAKFGAVVAMIIMIVAVDQALWRPLVVWSQRFKMEETAGEEQPRSWVLNLLRRSRIHRLLTKWFGRPHAAGPVHFAGTGSPTPQGMPTPMPATTNRRRPDGPVADRLWFTVQLGDRFNRAGPSLWDRTSPAAALWPLSGSPRNCRG